MRASSVKVIFTVFLLLSTVMVGAGTDDTTEADDGPREGDWIPDPRMRGLIKNITDSVTEDYMYSKIEGLTAFGTRYTHSIQNPKAVQWIEDELEGYGYTVERHNFTHHATPGISNVIATLPGTGSGGIVILCAHLDSTNWPESWNFPETTAPGADDDATGVAIVLAAAKVLSQYRFEQEIRFIGFNAEELSRAVGSTHYSENVSLKGEDLKAVLNVDMVGYNDNYIYEEVVYSVPSHYIFTDYISPVNEEYEFIDTLNAVETQNNPNSWGDIEPFWDRGYKGLTFAESDSPRFNSSFYKANPHYHSETDTIDTLNMELVTRCGQLVIGSLVLFADPTIPDLAMEKVTVPGGIVFDQEEIVVEATVGNVGNFDAYDVPVEFHVDGILNTTKTVFVSESGKVNLTFNWTAEPGDHEFVILVDPANIIGEWDDTNNKGSGSLTVLVKPDIELQEFNITQEVLNEGDSTKVSVRAFNHGPTGIECNFFLTDDRVPSEPFADDFFYLEPEESWEKAYIWSSGINGTHVLKGRLSGCFPQDRNESNSALQSTVEVNGRPVGRFLINPIVGGLTHQEILFSAEASSDDAGIEDFNFDFGDGNGTGWVDIPVVHHNYSDDGLYEVILIIRDAEGAESKPISLVVTIENRLPVAKISSDRQVGDTVIAETGAPITFYSNLSYDVDGEIISYNWTFMPGLSGSTKQSPVITFPRMGEYSARLIIRDDDGDEGVSSIRISITNRPPVAVIDGPKEAVVGEQVQFMGSGSFDQDSGGVIRTHRWNMGDGTISTEPDPNHIYRIAGNFTVELRVEDKHGGVDITTWKVSVTEEPKEEEEGLMAADYTALGLFVVVLVVCIIAQSVMGTRPRKPPRTKKGKKKIKKRKRGS